MGDIGQQARLGLGRLLRPDLTQSGAVGKTVAFLQQRRNQHDRQIAEQHQLLGHQGPLRAFERDGIGSKALHAAADSQDGDDGQAERDPQHAQPDGNQQQQWHGGKGNRHLLQEKHRVGEDCQPPQKDDRLSGAGRHPVTGDFPSGQRKAEARQHGDAERMAEPPRPGGIRKVRAGHPPEHTAGEDGRRNGGDEGGCEQKTGGPLYGSEVQGRRKPPYQQDREADLEHVGDGEHHRQRDRIAHQQVPRRDPRGDQSAERQVIERSTRGSQPDHHRESGRTPERRDHTG